MVETGHYAEEKSLRVFAWERWGPGSIITLTISLVAGSVLIIEGFETQIGIDFFAASLAFLYAGVVFVVKIFEEIHPIKRVNHDIVGMHGKVITEPGGLGAGVVKIGPELWSAWSKSALQPGESVLVVRRDGNHIEVERLEMEERSSPTQIRPERQLEN